MSRHTKFLVLVAVLASLAIAAWTAVPIDAFAYEPPLEAEQLGGDQPEPPGPGLPDSGDADEILIRFAPPDSPKGDLPSESVPRDNEKSIGSRFVSEMLQTLITWIHVTR